MLHFKINYEKPATPLEATIVAAARELAIANPSERLHYSYMAVWRHLLQFAATEEKTELSAELGESYFGWLEANEAPQRPNPERYMSNARRGVRTLLYFSSHGVWDPQRASRLHRMLPIIHLAKPEDASTPLESTIISALRAMKSQGYPDCTCERYSRIWRHLLKFAAEQNKREVSAELCDKFLAAYRGAVEFSGPPLKARMQMAYRATRALMHFVVEDAWKAYHPRKTPPMLPARFADDLCVYLDYSKDERGARPETLRFSRSYLQEFLIFLGGKHASDWSNVPVGQLSAFFATKTSLCPRSLDHVSETLRGFLRFLFMTGRMEQDWSNALPRFRSFADQSIPVTWPSGTLDALLRSVDRDSAQGKRDYAILLLASRLGMRAGDIRTLRLESLCWEDARIEFVQRKTGRMTTLPLPEEVGNAIIDYLLNGRPVVRHPEVFLRLRAPYGPMTCSLNHILDRYRRGLQTPFPSGRAGMHSFRHTLARAMLASETPLETIADVLGHASIRSTQIYVKVDLPQLRSAALDPEEVHHA